ncbi:MAG: SPOR domain-containing protein [Cyclobacteriaceae bacterium]
MRIDRLIVALVIIVASCKPAKVATSSSGTAYKEDLSVNRPSMEPLPEEPLDNGSQEIAPAPKPLVGHIKAEMDSINILIAQKNESIDYIGGFTIQVYTGLNREEADQAYELAMTLDQELSPEITYRQPSYKVKVGHYTSRLEANEIFQSLKEYFPNALMIPERKAK